MFAARVRSKIALGTVDLPASVAGEEPLRVISRPVDDTDPTRRVYNRPAGRQHNRLPLPEVAVVAVSPSQPVLRRRRQAVIGGWVVGCRRVDGQAEGGVALRSAAGRFSPPTSTGERM